jgi:arsenate reductase
VNATEIDLSRGLTEAEIADLIGARDYKLFLNPRNELYRERNFKEKPPSRTEAIRLLAQHPNLMKRPILVSGSKIALGFDEKAFSDTAGL